ncbi:MAG: hypothetical protein FWD12_13195 [Alphaproteobacteria bacterium]|nr:hypothetical protein [Alphaproteobacteria bacterium]
MDKLLKWSQFTGLVEEDPGLMRKWQLRDGPIVLLTEAAGLRLKEGLTDGREKNVYLQYDVLLTRVAAELARAGLEGSRAASMVKGWWFDVLGRADAAERGDPTLWVAVYPDPIITARHGGDHRDWMQFRLLLDVGSYDELKDVTGLQGDGAWRIVMVNLTRLTRAIRAQAKAMGIELLPRWEQEGVFSPEDSRRLANKLTKLRTELLSDIAEERQRRQAFTPGGGRR